MILKEGKNRLILTFLFLDPIQPVINHLGGNLIFIGFVIITIHFWNPGFHIYIFHPFQPNF